MSNKLSHSSVSRYSKCPKSYELYYKQKLRPNSMSAALLFGSALDETFNSILLKDGRDPMAVFIDKWEKAIINNQPVAIKTDLNVVYAASDFDGSILLPEDLKELKEALNAPEMAHVSKDPLTAYDECLSFKKQAEFRPFRDIERQYLNYATWLSCLRKAQYLIDEYNTQVLPRIKEVKAVQKFIELANESGDKVTGVIDFIAVMDDGNTYIMDNKTSSRPYDADKVKSSPQLALYGYAENIQHGGFIVLMKTLKKDKVKICSSCGHDGSASRAKTCDNTIKGSRCGADWNEKVTPRAEIQFVLDRLPQNTQNLVLENFEDVNKGINLGYFPKNLHACDDWYGQPCPYKGVCWSNSVDGLSKVE